MATRRPAGQTGVIAIDQSEPARIRDFHYHSRDWRGFRYVYPVLSRRSRGLSIGINLNPDTACNFACIYCQVDRTREPLVRHVDVSRLRDELDMLLEEAVTGRLFCEPEFADTPENLRRLNDIAFSGDGEPTTCPVLAECVQLAADLKKLRCTDNVKLVLITDACYLTRPALAEALTTLDRSNGVIWAKLDAGTEEYFRVVNRPNFPLAHVLENIIQTAKVRPIVIQSLFMRIDGHPPSRSEIVAYADRLNGLVRAGAKIEGVQIYTVARPPAERLVTPLDAAEIEEIVTLVRDSTSLPIDYFG